MTDRRCTRLHTTHTKTDQTPSQVPARNENRNEQNDAEIAQDYKGGQLLVGTEEAPRRLGDAAARQNGQ